MEEQQTNPATPKKRICSFPVIFASTGVAAICTAIDLALQPEPEGMAALGLGLLRWFIHPAFIVLLCLLCGLTAALERCKTQGKQAAMLILILPLWFFLWYGLILLGPADAQMSGLLYAIPLILIFPRFFNAKPAEQEQPTPKGKCND